MRLRVELANAEAGQLLTVVVQGTRTEDPAAELGRGQDTPVGGGFVDEARWTAEGTSTGLPVEFVLYDSVRVRSVAVYANGLLVGRRDLKEGEDDPDGELLIVTVDLEKPDSSPDARAGAAVRRLQGRVVDYRGEGIPGARVSLSQNGMPVAEAVTADDGSWSAEVPAGAVTVRVRSEDYDADTVLDVDEAPATVVMDHLVVLEPESAPTPSAPPRVPDAQRFAASAEVSQDLGSGATGLWVPDRSVEIAEITTLVRLQEPSLAAQAPAPGGRVSKRTGAAVSAGPSTVVEGPAHGSKARFERKETPDSGRLDLEEISRRIPALEQVDIFRPELLYTSGAVDGAQGRWPLDATHRLDLEAADGHAAVSISLAHVLRHRQEWKADGYSLGSLLYSLPLAPGQRKNIAIVDWRRSERGRREEEARAEDSLTAETSQLRDVAEIVRTSMSESTTASSSSTSAGLGMGMGQGAAGSVGGVGLSAMLGVSGGIGHAQTEAQQESMREVAGRSSQQVSEATRQAATAVRARRSTTVQVVDQSEEASVSTEVVANHNHSHAMTVQYFEVLRHLVVETRLDSVDEALLVPVPVQPWSAIRAARHESALRQVLPRTDLVAGLDALLATADGEPVASSAVDEPLGALTGQLTVRADLPAGAVKQPDLLTMATMVSLVGELRLTAQDGTHATVDLSLSDAAADGSTGVTYTFSCPVQLTRRNLASVSAVVRGELPEAVTQLLPGVLAAAPAVDIRLGSLTWIARGATRTLTTPVRLRHGQAQQLVLLGDPELAENPRGRGASRTARLLRHLESNRLAYNKVVWAGMDPDQRFMALDRVLAPAFVGRRLSLASIVENRLLGFVGNCLVMPAVPGLDLTRAVLGTSLHDSRAQYSIGASASTERVTVPTGGVFAEAILGSSNASERIDDTRFWRWEESPIDDAPEVSPVSTESRGTAMDLTSRIMDQAAVSLPGLSQLPAPSGLHDALAAVAVANAFRDITGVDATARNAAEALKTTVDAARSLGEKAGQAAVDVYKTSVESQASQRRLDQIEEARRRGNLDDADAGTRTREELDRSSTRSSAGGASDTVPDGGSQPADGEGAAPSSGGGGTTPPPSQGETTPPSSRRHPAPGSGRRVVRRDPRPAPAEGVIDLKFEQTFRRRVGLVGHVYGPDAVQHQSPVRLGYWEVALRIGHLTNGSLVPLSVRVVPHLLSRANQVLQSAAAIESRVLRTQGVFRLEVEVVNTVSSHPVTVATEAGLELGLGFWRTALGPLLAGENNQLTVKHTRTTTRQTSSVWARGWAFSSSGDEVVSRPRSPQEDLAPDEVIVEELASLPLSEWKLETLNVG